VGDVRRAIIKETWERISLINSPQCSPHGQHKCKDGGQKEDVFQVLNQANVTLQRSMGKHRGKGKETSSRHKLSKSSRFEIAWDGSRATSDFDSLPYGETRGKPFNIMITPDYISPSMFTFISYVKMIFSNRNFRKS